MATISTKQVLARAHISADTFRQKRKALGLKPAGTVETGRRGRPQFLWNESVVAALGK